MKEPAVDRNTMKEPAIDRNTMKKPAEYPLQESASEGTAEYVPPEVNVPRLLRKIDRRVLPMIFIVYVFAFLDRY